MKGEVKFFGLVTAAIVVGEILATTKSVVLLKHPGWFITAGAGKGGKVGIYPVVPELLPDWNRLSARIKVPQITVLYSGSPPQKILNLYDEMRANMTEAATGIRVATTKDLEKIAKVGRRPQPEGRAFWQRQN